MGKETLKILLIEDDPDFAAIVQAWLSPREDVDFVLSWTDTLLDGLERISQGGVDTILLDLGLPDSTGAATFHTAHSHARNIPILLLSGSADEALAMEMVRAGAQDYLVKDTCGQDRLVRALLYGMLRKESAKAQPQAEPQNATTIAVLAAKGGVGTTTFACTLTAELRRQTKQDSLLIDLDLHSNGASFLFELEAKYSITDALLNTHRLDRSVWDSIVSHGPEEMHVLTSAALYGRKPPQLDKLRQMLSRVVLFYPWIVLDLGRLNEHNRGLLDSLHQIVLLTSTSVSSLYQTKEMLAALRDTGINLNKFRLVATALSSEKPMPLASLEQLVPMPIAAYLPPSLVDIETAMTRKELTLAGSRYRASIASLARELAGLPEKRSPGAWEQFLALGGIRRRTVQGNPA